MSGSSQTVSQPVATRPLEALVETIREAIAAGDAAMQSGIENYIKAGEALIEAKKQLDHGEWLPWLRANFDLSNKTAQNYVRLARNPQRVSHLPTVRAALAELTNPKKGQNVRETGLKNLKAQAKTVTSPTAVADGQKPTPDLLGTTLAEPSSGRDSPASDAEPDQNAQTPQTAAPVPESRSESESAQAVATVRTVPPARVEAAAQLELTDQAKEELRPLLDRYAWVVLRDALEALKPSNER